MKVKSLLPTLALAGAGAALLARARREKEPYSFRDQVVFITGGSRGLGLLVARLLAAEGARIAIMARDSNELDRAVADLRSRGADAFAITGDVASEQAVQEVVAALIERWGRIDILVNMAGIIQVGPLDHMSKKDFEAAFAVHLWGPYHTMQAVIPHMRERGEGRIVNIASIGGKVAVPYMLPYSASKFALVGLSDGMRAELAEHNIHVTTVSPWLMRTGGAVNALFKGRQEQEYALFLPLASLPVATISAEKAAEQIVEATRRKLPDLTVGVQARLAILTSTLFPGLFAHAMQFVSKLLPDPTGPSGDIQQTGLESRSKLSETALAAPTYEAAERNNELGDQPVS